MNVCGEMSSNLRLVEKDLEVTISQRGDAFSVSGRENRITQAERVIRDLCQIADAKSEPLTPSDVHLALNRSDVDVQDGQSVDSMQVMDGVDNDEVVIKMRKMLIRGQNPRQKHYLRSIRDNDISFGVGPAGTGKTYLAVACAVQALSENQIERILLVRPAVEAGERLGFLPGDIGQKIDPYLRPLFDALYEMLGFERVGKLIARGTIELAPLAYMRGRTLNDAFVILDEAQNTTVEQMKMFLTRIGFGSKAIITGDATQIDLPRGQKSGLKHAVSLLQDVNGISICRFQPRDVVRHPLVQRIVEAYEAEDEQKEKQKAQAQSAQDAAQHTSNNEK